MPNYIIRVYGIVINEKEELLVSLENYHGLYMYKFPGGGLEEGEGSIDALHREFEEELQCKIQILNHFYTTDFYQTSAFNVNKQVLSIYYRVALKSLPDERYFQITDQEVLVREGAQKLKWVAIKDLDLEEFTFPIDKHVAQMLIENFAR